MSQPWRSRSWNVNTPPYHNYQFLTTKISKARLLWHSWNRRVLKSTAHNMITQYCGSSKQPNWLGSLSYLLSHRIARLSSSRFRHKLQNFLLKCPGSDQQWALGNWKESRQTFYFTLTVESGPKQSMINDLDMLKCSLINILIPDKDLSSSTYKLFQW